MHACHSTSIQARGHALEVPRRSHRRGLADGQTPGDLPGLLDQPGTRHPALGMTYSMKAHPHRPPPSTVYPGRASSCQPEAPLFRWGQAAIGNVCVPPELLRVVEGGQESPPPLLEYPDRLPLFELPLAGAWTGILSGKRTPWGPGPPNPETSLTAAAIIGPRTSAPRPGLRAGAMDSNSFPWLVVESSARYV